MPNTSSSQVPYPAGTDAPFAAADMQALAEHIDKRLVLRATDQADRDARYLTPTPGMVVAGDDGTVWVADSSGLWHTAYQPIPGWVNVTLASGLVDPNSAQARKVGSQVWLRGTINTSDASPLPSGDIGFLPSGYAPASRSYYAAATSVGGAHTYAAMRLGINDTGIIYVSADQDPEGIADWVALDGITFWTT